MSEATQGEGNKAMKGSKEFGTLVRMNGEAAEYSCGHRVPVDEMGNGNVARVCPECASPGQRCIGCNRKYDANRGDGPSFKRLELGENQGYVCKPCEDKALAWAVKQTTGK